MSALSNVGRVTGWTCIAIGVVQVVGGARIEPGMGTDPTVDSHVRFMGSVFAGYGLSWLDAAAPDADLARMRLLAGLMAAGGMSRLVTRASLGRPHRFHDLLLGMELAYPVVVELAGRRSATVRNRGEKRRV